MASVGSCDYGRVPEERPPAPESSVEPTIVTDLCKRFRVCKCPAYVFEGRDSMSCLEAASALAQRWIQGAQAAGLTYDGSCLYGKPSSQCSGLQFTDERRNCQIYHGEADVGQDCEAFGPYMSTCEASACGIDDKCHANDFPRNGLLGHRCGVELGDFTPCAAGLACSSGRCVVGAAEGEACDADVPCDRTGWCDAGVCASLIAGGGLCPEGPLHEACASGSCTSEYGGLCAEDVFSGCVGFSW